MSEVHVVIDGCATPSGGDVRPIRTRDTTDARANWNFNAEKVVIGLTDRLGPRQMDWLEIHSAIFAADRAVEREPGLDWTRSIELHVPVRDPKFWTARRAAFQDIFSSLTYDRLHLNFYDGDTFAEAPRTRLRPFASADSIALLSGGMDSFVGALELMKTQGAKPLFLAASGSGATHHSQNEVSAVIRSLDADRELLRLTAQRRTGFPGDERSQRSRSFLFASAAAVVAAASGFEDVYVNENGIMAIHLPLTPARAGSFSTRTASPRVLEQMAELASSSLGAPIRINNLLVGRTKPEVAELGSRLGHGDDLRKTVSCWSISHTSKHCGHCAPCLTRRISSLAHDIPDAEYELDVFNDAAALDKDDAKDALTHLIELAETFRDEEDADLELDYPELLGGGRALTLRDTTAMYRRWSEQALGVLGRYPVPSRFIS
jgi:7-cyano-7-deazaguanine synthase in queuosine biosynthesis